MKEEWFRKELLKVIKELKFELIDRALDVAKNGKRSMGGSPEISYVQAVIKALDNNILFDTSEDKPDEDALNAGELDKHLDRLGLGDVADDKPQGSGSS